MRSSYKVTCPHHCIKGEGTGETFHQVQGYSISLYPKAPRFPAGSRRTGERNRVLQMIREGTVGSVP